MTEAEQIAERLAPPHSEVCRSHVSGVCDCWRERQRIAILDALREVEQRHHSTACAPAEGPLGGVECACFRSGLAAVTMVRCSEHYAVPQQNKTEHGGGECGGCIAERAEKAEAEHGVLRRYVGSEIYMSDFQRERANKLEAEVERLRSKLTATQVRANEYAAEVERLREALEGLLESPASFEDSRIDYAERQVDTKVWDEAKAALAGRPGAERAPADEPKG